MAAFAVQVLMTVGCVQSGPAAGTSPGTEGGGAVETDDESFDEPGGFAGYCDVSGSSAARWFSLRPSSFWRTAQPFAAHESGLLAPGPAAVRAASTAGTEVVG